MCARLMASRREAQGRGHVVKQQPCMGQGAVMLSDRGQLHLIIQACEAAGLPASPGLVPVADSGLCLAYAYMSSQCSKCSTVSLGDGSRSFHRLHWLQP